jgi:hypothetical protein
METQVRTPQMVFMQPQRLIVPLFQRPYVWNEVAIQQASAACCEARASRVLSVWLECGWYPGVAVEEAARS